MVLNAAFWLVVFNKAYWQDPTPLEA